jgi:hypothetical protein
MLCRSSLASDHESGHHPICLSGDDRERLLIAVRD